MCLLDLLVRFRLSPGLAVSLTDQPGVDGTKASVATAHLQQVRERARVRLKDFATKASFVAAVLKVKSLQRLDAAEGIGGQSAADTISSLR